MGGQVCVLSQSQLNDKRRSHFGFSFFLAIQSLRTVIESVPLRGSVWLLLQQLTPLATRYRVVVLTTRLDELFREAH